MGFFSKKQTSRMRNAYCSFCRKSWTEVGPLAEGPGDVYICHKCVLACKDLIENELERRARTPSGSAPSA
jgi:ATP-dependent Clp protease ATP-binding subunit ClpX